MRIVIIGGGATGALTALHLARALRKSAIEIVVIEPAEEIGRGLAYATDDPRHLLNVRVGNMSAFADLPDHLFQWLQRVGPVRGIACATQFCFIPRGIYGAYLADLVRELSASGAVRHVRDRCIDLVEIGDSVVLTLRSGRTIVTASVVLATGNDGKPALLGIPAARPWAEGALSKLDSDVPVLIVGTGLTMVDKALSLDRQGHRGTITALSPRGLLPSAHRPVKPFAISTEDVPFRAELSEIAAWLRGLSLAMTSEGGDWRSAIDALRPHTQPLWRSMSLVQRRRFLRHARAYWDVLRHRMAPEVETQIAALRAAGRLEIVAGRIVHAEQGNDGITVNIARRGQDEIEKRKFARLVDCTGLADDPHRWDNPLIRALLARGAARTDPLGIGLDISEDYALIDESSRRSNRVRAVGPLARATFWECIAIPDIRLQCGHLAEVIATNLTSKARDNGPASASAALVAQQRRVSFGADPQTTSVDGIRSKLVALRVGGYDRIIRHRGSGIEAVEITWHPGTRTPKHNHSSRGWVWVLRGRIFEVRNGKKTYFEAGDSFLEVDGEETHIVGNDTRDLAITFHVYQPELQMGTFSESEMDIVAVLM
jgi:uncharacterized NAD(P)/FAD-binding protein YdhS/quercetin dioxygenase-like cupin family protein